MKKLQVLATLVGSLVFNALADADFSWQPDIQISEKENHVIWQDALTLLYSGMVRKVSQYHSLKVQLILKNGNKYITYEPAIDEIIKDIKSCGEPCKNILIAIE